MFDREPVVKFSCSLAVESAKFNPDVSCSSANRDGSLLKLPCDIGNGFCAMPQVPNPPDDPQKACLPLQFKDLPC
jgi:hypothetical protein